jgi:hypothetical protein
LIHELANLGARPRFALYAIESVTGRVPPSHTWVMEFTTELLSTGGNTAGFVVPDAVVEELSSGRRPKVAATVNGHTWRTSIAPIGGRFLLGASAAVREAAGIAGQTHTVTVELDSAPRTVEIPADLADAFVAHPAAAAAWERLSYSNQRRYAEAIAAAKAPATREGRIASTIATLSD